MIRIRHTVLNAGEDWNMALAAVTLRAGPLRPTEGGQ
jgi:hypothetical protein